MKVAEKATATAPLAEYTAEVKKEPVVVTSKGKPIAALLPIENADLVRDGIFEHQTEIP